MAFIDNRNTKPVHKGSESKSFEQALFVYGDLASAYYQGRLDNRDMSERPPRWEEVSEDFKKWYNDNYKEK